MGPRFCTQEGEEQGPGCPVLSRYLVSPLWPQGQSQVPSYVLEPGCLLGLSPRCIMGENALAAWRRAVGDCFLGVTAGVGESCSLQRWGSDGWTLGQESGEAGVTGCRGPGGVGVGEEVCTLQP